MVSVTRTVAMGAVVMRMRRPVVVPVTGSGDPAPERPSPGIEPVVPVTVTTAGHEHDGWRRDHKHRSPWGVVMRGGPVAGIGATVMNLAVGSAGHRPGRCTDDAADHGRIRTADGMADDGAGPRTEKRGSDRVAGRRGPCDT